jgi:hypothetical protein
MEKKMKKHLILFGVAVLLSGIVISGCFESQSLSSEEKRFVGTWNMDGMESPVTFHSNGEISGFFGEEYEIKDGKLVILKRFAGGYRQESYNYTFSNNDTRLILINIKTEVTHKLIKQ